MRRLALMLLAAMTMLLAACDPFSTEELVVVNKSGQAVTIIRYDTYASQITYDSIGPEELHTDTIKLKNGDSLLVAQNNHPSTTSYEIATNNIKYDGWKDSVRFLFEDGTEKLYLADKDILEGPYAFGSDSYTYEERKSDERQYRHLTLWSRLTYTIAKL